MTRQELLTEHCRLIDNDCNTINQLLIEGKPNMREAILEVLHQDRWYDIETST